MKYILPLVMSPILFLSCNKSKNLYALEKEVVEWAGIDEVVKEAFIFNSRNEILDLDANEIIKIKDSSIVGIYKGKKSFLLGGVRYSLKWNANREIFPFVKKDSALYILYNDGGGASTFRTEKILSKYTCYKFKIY